MADLEREIKREEKKVASFFKKKENIWMIVSAVLAIIIIIMLVWPSGMSKTKAGNYLVDSLNSRVGGGVSLINVSSFGSLYEVNVLYQGQEIPVYITKDGKYMAAGVQELEPAVTDNSDTNTGDTSTPTDVPKTDKPKVELFVMTYCPYGTQSEKGLIPVLELLGNKIDGKIRFVHYFMHGDTEENETYTQLCIREQQSAKFLPYLKCFLTDGNSTRCLKETGINTAMLNTCLKTNAKNYYAADSALSEQYGVQGSPTLIINGVESNAGRSSSSYLTGVCSAFNNPASECSSTLDSASPSPGFGYTASSGSSSASCGA